MWQCVHSPQSDPPLPDLLCWTHFHSLASIQGSATEAGWKQGKPVERTPHILFIKVNWWMQAQRSLWFISILINMQLLSIKKNEMERSKSPKEKLKKSRGFLQTSDADFCPTMKFKWAEFKRFLTICIVPQRQILVSTLEPEKGATLNLYQLKQVVSNYTKRGTWFYYWF